MTRYVFIHNVWYMFKNIWVIQISVLFLNIKNIIVIVENRNVLIYYLM